MKFVHAADLHLDSPLAGLPEYDGAPVFEVRSATRRAFATLIERSLEENVDLVVVAGDLYDGEFRDYSTALFLAEQVRRLREIDAPFVWIRGNHDAQSRVTRHLRLSEGAFELGVERAETRVFDELGVAVHGRGYATRDVVENLARSYPPPEPGLFNIGLLHTALDGRVGHAPYAPTTTSELTAHGYQYWALGHVHRREVIASDPYVVFPGNLQGRHVRETGAKGASFVTVEGGRVSLLEHRVLDVVRWSVIEIDARSMTSFADAVDAAFVELRRELDGAEGRVLAVRVRFSGATRIHGELLRRSDELLAELRRASIELGGTYLEKVELRTTGPWSADVWSERTDALSVLFRSIRELRSDEEARAELCARLERPLAGLPAEIVKSELQDFDALVAEAERLLEARLLDLPEDES